MQCDAFEQVYFVHRIREKEVGKARNQFDVAMLLPKWHLDLAIKMFNDLDNIFFFGT